MGENRRGGAEREENRGKKLNKNNKKTLKQTNKNDLPDPSSSERHHQAVDPS